MIASSFTSCGVVAAKALPLLLALVGLAYFTACSPRKSSLPLNPLGSASSSLTDLEGNAVDPFASAPPKGVVFIFVSTECPLSNQVLPELARLADSFAPQGMRFWLVHVDRSEPLDRLRQHAKDYQVRCGVLRDVNREMVNRAQVKVTPEAAVFSESGQLIYHGRINDRFAALGKGRPEASRHDLQEVLASVVGGQPLLTNYIPAVGCYIADLP